MKKIVKYTFLTLLSGWLAIGCTSNFEEYNTDPYAPQEADPNMLLPTMVEALTTKAQQDKAFEAKMSASVTRVLTLKEDMGLLRCGG